MKTVRDIIDNGAKLHPDRPFLHATEGVENHLSWAQLQTHSREINALLNYQKIEPQETVAFLLDNGYWTTLLLLGVMYSGRVVLALNALSGPEALSYVTEHSEAKIFFVNEHYKSKFKDLFNHLSTTSKIIDADESSGLPPDITSFNNNLCEISENDTAILMYTSGTTGKPKGVLLSHQNVVAGGKNTMVAHDLSPDDVALCVLPLYHINAQMVSVMGTLISGGQLVISPKFSASKFWQDIAKYKCSWFSIVPTIISYLIEHNADGVTDEMMQTIKSQVRFGRSASAALSPAKHQKFEQRFGIHIIETMGLTETAAQILSNPMPPKTIKYGSPGITFGNDAKIINKSGSDAETRKIGELMIRGDNVMKGYYKNEIATKEALNKDGWLHTGDLAYEDEDGFFFITGRLKELIIKGGENIAPREIDDILYAHPAVLEAAAFGIDDEHYGQEIMASVALCPGMQVSEQELVKLCVDKLGKYKAPKEISFLKELPKGPSGKIQRLKLSI